MSRKPALTEVKAKKLYVEAHKPSKKPKTQKALALKYGVSRGVVTAVISANGPYTYLNTQTVEY